MVGVWVNFSRRILRDSNLADAFLRAEKYSRRIEHVKARVGLQIDDTHFKYLSIELEVSIST